MEPDRQLVKLHFFGTMKQKILICLTKIKQDSESNKTEDKSSPVFTQCALIEFFTIQGVEVWDKPLWWLLRMCFTYLHSTIKKQLVLLWENKSTCVHSTLIQQCIVRGPCVFQRSLHWKQGLPQNQLCSLRSTLCYGFTVRNLHVLAVTVWVRLAVPLLGLPLGWGHALPVLCVISLSPSSVDV